VPVLPLNRKSTDMALGNQVLARLSESDLALLQPHLKPYELTFRRSIEKPGRRIEYAVFPDEGIVSVVANGMKGAEVEVGIIGYDSMTVQSVVMGTDRSPNSTYVQLAGRGQCIKVDAYRKAIDSSRTLHSYLLAVVQSFMMQASSTAFANGRSTIEARLARWLLMAHDRVEGDAMLITHELLSVMLGVRRAGVTMALNHLESNDSVVSKRGIIVVRDRKALETLAGRTYGIAEAEQERLTGWKSQKAR
jgi:CRP-like cAMP-binding protein